MHVKRLITLAAAVAVVGAGGLAAAVSAGAATTACGAGCTDVSFVRPGHNFILKSVNGLNSLNNPIALRPGDNFVPGEDFSPQVEGTVVPLYCTPGGQSQPGSVFTPNQCHLLVANGYGPDETWQLAFNPDNGGPQTMCVSTWDNQAPSSGNRERLAPCGDTAASIQILASHLPGGHTAAPGFVWIVNGASSNFSNPLVATVQNTPNYQVVRWDTVEFNGMTGIDTQEAVGHFGPFI